MSRWKAGQIVTIEGKRYRVTKFNSCLCPCIFCEFRCKEPNEYPCTECVHNNKVPSLIPYETYLKEIKPKS